MLRIPRLHEDDSNLLCIANLYGISFVSSACSGAILQDFVRLVSILNGFH